MRWDPARDAELLDGVMVLLAVAARTPSGLKVPAVVVDLVDQLDEQISAHGNAADPAPTMVGMGCSTSADLAGAAVGLTGSRVRQLCREQLVAHEVVAGRYLVDVDDLRAHIAGRP